MIFIRDLDKINIVADTVLTIGKFDGLHMGHKKLLDFVSQKKRRGLKSVIFTFDIPPRRVISDAKDKVLTTLGEKELVFSNLGIDYFVECPFTESIRMMEADEFIRMVVDKFHVKCFVVGMDCHFGHNRSGDYRVLEKYAPKYGYDVVVVEKLQYHGRDVSSTYVREKIEAGRIEIANKLLGYPYFIMEKVVGGNRLGRTIGFPTMNQIPSEEKLLPPYGVYASRVPIGDKIYDAVTNIGIKPTIEGTYPCTVETHIIDFTGDLYDQNLKVRLFSFIRPEEKFSGLEALKKQLLCDKENAKIFLDKNKSVPKLNWSRVR